MHSAVFLLGILYFQWDTIQGIVSRLSFQNEESVSVGFQENIENGVITEEMYTFFHDQEVKNPLEMDKLNHLMQLYETGSKSDLRTFEFSEIDAITPYAVTFTVEKTEITKQLPSGIVAEDSLSPVHYFNQEIDTNGNLKDGWSYLIIQMNVANSDEDTIPVYYQYWDALHIFFLNDSGELFWELYEPNYVSYQPGTTQQQTFYLQNMKPGDSFDTYYIFTVPDSAVNQYHTSIVINQWGDGLYDLEQSYLFVVE